MITNTITGTPSNHPSMYFPMFDLHWYCWNFLANFPGFYPGPVILIFNLKVKAI